MLSLVKNTIAFLRLIDERRRVLYNLECGIPTPIQTLFYTQLNVETIPLFLRINLINLR